ncbi:MAG: epsF 4 [Planctomycetaceae bacterium]|nr:epsF 4 [Planctomycetaceae bacterium]
MFGSTIPLKTLSFMCRSMATMLQSGVPIVKVVETVARNVQGPACQRRMRAVVEKLKMGDDVRSAFASQEGYFPDLFIDMVAVADETGSLPEVLKSLADHYENLLRLRRDFIGQIALPILQLIAAIFIITFVIFILGAIAESRGGTPIDVFGWGLTGSKGAAIFFFGSFGTFFLIYLAYLFAVRGFRQERTLHTIFLKVPVLGQCMRAFAIARFSWAFALTQQAGMRIVPSLEASLKATANYAFIGATPRMCALIKQGEDLSTVINDSGLFTTEFEQMVSVAETSGTVPETLQHLSPQFEDSARRSLRALAMAFGWVVWALVAAFIIFAIFSLASFYIGMLNDAAKGI